jgi:hypothetical protein
VAFAFSGFLQPVTNTAHDYTTASVFKAGSTVPLKFQLKNASGATVQPSWAPYIGSLVQGPAMSGTASATTYTTTGTVGSSFRSDAASQQWIYNWGTRGLPANYYYTITVKLSDQSTKTVIIGLTS